MTQNAGRPTTALMRFSARVGPIILALVGLIFLGIGGTLLASQTWDKATGQVGTCNTRVDPPEPGGRTGNRASTVHYMCAVTWEAGGSRHSSTLDLGAAPPASPTVDLRISGDTVVIATPPWLGAGLGAFGLVLVAGAVTWFVPSRRAR